ncbi:MAG: ferritin family protein [Dictyoglomus sp.]|nr:ferritin family protein [Dictyoglomus sp.]MCX7942414.1 ferritin family protein [Dictyoglomaceae bacterium]MDW8188925.1 ferritin family protein [Dictyoglomus sp.]
MVMIFSSKDILEMAIHMEEEGEKFYNLFSEKTSKESIKNVFNYLAMEEKRHAETFKEIYKSIENEEFLSAYPDEEANKYLHLWISSKIFINWDKILKEKTFFDEKSALDLAISLEKDSILFYYEISEFVSSNNKNLLREIIKQEKSHLSQLTTLREAFS